LTHREPSQETEAIEMTPGGKKAVKRDADKKTRYLDSYEGFDFL
jgi:hypothetical protein